MTNPSSVLGKISVPLWPGWEPADDLNRNAIGNLLPRDEWSALSAPMFSADPDAPAYDCRIIHFAASMKGIEDAWDEWIGKLEGLLGRMSWISTDVYLETEMFGEHHYWWVAEDPEPGAPVTRWVREGGPWKAADFERPLAGQ